VLVGFDLRITQVGQRSLQRQSHSSHQFVRCGKVYGRLDRKPPLPWYTWRKAESSLVMNSTIEFFRTRPSDEAHATLDRISIVTDNLNAATVKAKSDEPFRNAAHSRIKAGPVPIVKEYT